ncbi:LLM class flavin-dependent oxidoreductase [Sphingomonas ginkgonis]|uniref:Luciferase-like monooxygenase n=1 Tax=Sphingomonas ginkgonis TaxID=2315330 RepID=A0A429VAG1_9SPHN|nr:LLM class flavin-dependent oxidoreductase [Sphingomonas ginkgonis]RST30832.1 LLM class flavin-dependent oxidoreductase [Sphingomonas ginkgonis]
MPKLSVLDLAPITEGSDAGEALRRSGELAAHAEALGYNRYWMAEHHSMVGIASAATAVGLAYVGTRTSRIRIGAGGIMLPNHAPLIIAEQFGTLDALFPGRIDLGLGRAPGTDQAAAYAMRRNLTADENQFLRDVLELIGYFKGENGRVRAVPGEGANVPVWILGSSTYGAQLAAMLGLPYAFASHFAPQMMDQAVRVYRETFRPSEWLAEPYLMMGFNAIVADSDEEARLLATSIQQAVVALRTGQPRQLPPPVEGYADMLPMEARLMIDQFLSQAAIGAPDTAKAALDAFAARTGADELMVTSQIFDFDARKRSYELLMAVAGEGGAPATTAAPADEELATVS